MRFAVNLGSKSIFKKLIIIKSSTPRIGKKIPINKDQTKMYFKVKRIIFSENKNLKKLILIMKT